MTVSGAMNDAIFKLLHYNRGCMQQHAAQLYLLLRQEINNAP